MALQLRKCFLSPEVSTLGHPDSCRLEVEQQPLTAAMAVGGRSPARGAWQPSMGSLWPSTGTLQPGVGHQTLGTRTETLLGELQERNG